MNYLRERILVPILIPLMAVAVIGFVTLNLSRVFLAATGHKAVVAGSIAAAFILLVATVATTRERLSGPAVLGLTAVFGIVLITAGLIAQQVDTDRLNKEKLAGGEAAAAPAAQVTATAYDIGYREKQITAPAGEVKITLDNTGQGAHTFTIDQLGIDFEASGGQVASKTVKLQPGTYTFYCKIPGHRQAGMEGTLTVTAGAGGAAAPAGTTVSEEAFDIGFKQKQLTAPAGPVQLELKNTGVGQHTFTIDQLSIDIVADGGKTETKTVDLKPGTYTFYCKIPGHRQAGMEGTLTVTAGAGGGGASAAPGGGSAAVEAFDIGYKPTQVSLPAGSDTLSLKNTGVAQHTLTIDQLGVDIVVDGGKTGSKRLDLKPGTYTFYCKIPGHRQAGMEGTLTVT